MKHNWWHLALNSCLDTTAGIRLQSTKIIYNVSLLMLELMCLNATFGKVTDFHNVNIDH